MSSSQWTLNGQSLSNLVKVGHKVTDWSKERGLTANIDIFYVLQNWTTKLKMGYLEN